MLEKGKERENLVETLNENSLTSGAFGRDLAVLVPRLRVSAFFDLIAASLPGTAPPACLLRPNSVLHPHSARPRHSGRKTQTVILRRLEMQRVQQQIPLLASAGILPLVPPLL